MWIEVSAIFAARPLIDCLERPGRKSPGFFLSRAGYHDIVQDSRPPPAANTVTRVR